MESIIKPPLVLVGIPPFTPPQLGGVFQLVKSGVTLPDAFDMVESNGCAVCFLHYFASAKQDGWSDDAVFNAIHGAYQILGKEVNMESIRKDCLLFFNSTACTMPAPAKFLLGTPEHSRIYAPETEIGKEMGSALI